MPDERIEKVRQVLHSLSTGEDWEAAIEDGFPASLETLTREAITAYREGDVEWILEHTDPAVEITGPPEGVDSRVYRGHDGLLDCLLAGPRQWERFHLEPRRLFAVGDDQVVTVAIHRGRPRHVDLEIEAEIAWLSRWRDGRLTRWNMFLNVEDALEAAHRSEQR